MPFWCSAGGLSTCNTQHKKHISRRKHVTQWHYCSMQSWPRHQIVSGQLHAPVERSTSTLWSLAPWAPHTAWTFWRQQNLCLYRYCSSPVQTQTRRMVPKPCKGRNYVPSKRRETQTQQHGVTLPDDVCLWIQECFSKSVNLTGGCLLHKDSDTVRPALHYS